MIVRSSSAEWQGTLNEGKGIMTVGRGTYQGPFSFASRFESGQGTNPEELIGAAHAGCFSMFLSALITKAGFTPTRVRTTAAVSLGEGPTITLIELNTEAEIPGLPEEKLRELGDTAKKNCPISKALAGTQIKLNIKLVK
jgi:osmotically inducible protein OsmC